MPIAPSVEMLLPITAYQGAIEEPGLAQPPFIEQRLRPVAQWAAQPLAEPGEFIEIFVDTPLEACEERDPKGLYKKARRGELQNFTGLDLPNEPPSKPELILDALNESASDLADRIIHFMQQRDLIS